MIAVRRLTLSLQCFALPPSDASSRLDAGTRPGQICYVVQMRNSQRSFDYFFRRQQSRVYSPLPSMTATVTVFVFTPALRSRMHSGPIVVASTVRNRDRTRCVPKNKAGRNTQCRLPRRQTRISAERGRLLLQPVPRRQPPIAHALPLRASVHAPPESDLALHHAERVAPREQGHHRCGLRAQAPSPTQECRALHSSPPCLLPASSCSDRGTRIAAAWSTTRLPAVSLSPGLQNRRSQHVRRCLHTRTSVEEGWKRDCMSVSRQEKKARASRQLTRSNFPRHLQCRSGRMVMGSTRAVSPASLHPSGVHSGSSVGRAPYLFKADALALDVSQAFPVHAPTA